MTQSRNDPCPCGSGRKFKSCCLQRRKLADNGMNGLFQPVATAIPCYPPSPLKRPHDAATAAYPNHSDSPTRQSSDAYSAMGFRNSFPPSYDIAAANLENAIALPGMEGLDMPRCLRWVDDAAARVRFETERHLYRLVILGTLTIP